MKNIFFIILSVSALSTLLNAQTVKSAVSSAKHLPISSFYFQREWDYPWYVIKNDDGSFENTTGEKIRAKDTVHLYFTANCSTNVQGIYKIRYCQAKRSNGKLELIFEDGMPAYASSFVVRIEKDSFMVKPVIVYPSLQKTTISKVISQSLAVQIKNHKITGQINYQFMIDGSADLYYIKGYFGTIIKK